MQSGDFAEKRITMTPGGASALPTPDILRRPDDQPDPWAITLIRLIVHALLLFALTIALLGVVPRFARTFADFGMKLPFVTELIIDIASAMVQFAFFVPVVLAALLAVDWAALYCLQRNQQRSLARLWFFLILLLILGVAAGMFLAMYVPLMELHTGLSA